MKRWLASVVSSMAALSLVACAGAADPSDEQADEDALTSKDAQIVDLVFRGEVLAGKSDDAKKAIVTQLFYTVGPLTLREANSQVGRVALTDVVEHVEGTKKRISYTARLPVAWRKTARVAATQDIVLPRDLTRIAAFNAKYEGTCGTLEEGLLAESFWYNFDPSAYGCKLADAEVVRIKADVVPDTAVTKGKYPEYELAWSDGALDVVSVFNSHDGSGRREEVQKYVDGAKRALHGGTIKENPTTESLLRDITITGTVKVAGVERAVTITALEIDSLYESGPDFERRYGPLSERADLVTYVGHSVLGKNTRALSQMSRAKAGKYQLFVFNSCDSFAYADTTLTERHAAANGASDPKGTKYLDVMTNVLPSYVVNESSSLLLVLRAMLRRDTPATYDRILGGLPSDQMVVVWGEDDNAFHP
ncbi:MAG: Alkaline serine protease [Myxococcaceae bacterium]|nr:Alkaline serine protease [Myxococcaceae bacterium]